MSDWKQALASKQTGKPSYQHDYSKQNFDALKERVVTMERQMIEVKDMLSEMFISVDLAEKRVRIVQEVLDKQTEIMALMVAELKL